MTPDQQQLLVELSTLTQRALVFPRDLQHARQRSADAARRAKDLKQEIAEAETEARLNAALATDSTGKKAYPNDEARKAAAADQLAKSPAHRERLRALADAEGDALTASLDVSRIEDEHRSYRSVVELTIAKVQLLVAGR